MIVGSGFFYRWIPLTLNRLSKKEGKIRDEMRGWDRFGKGRIEEDEYGLEKDLRNRTEEKDLKVKGVRV